MAIFSYCCRLVILTALFYAAGWLSLQVVPTPAAATLIWIPAGLALGVVLLWGYRYLPAVAAGAALISHLHFDSPVLTLFTAVGTTWEIWASAWMCRRLGMHLNLSRVRDVLHFALATVLVGTPPAALMGGLGLWLAGLAQPEQLAGAMAAWWVGHLFGILVVTPLMLTWAIPHRPTDLEQPEALEALGIVALLVLGGATLFVDAGGWGVAVRPFFYATLPGVCWAALRFGSRGAATATLLLTTLTAAATLDHHGLFTQGTLLEDLEHFIGFSSVVALTSLLLAAAAAEQRGSRRALHTSEKTLRTLVTHIPDIITMIDREGRIRFINRVLPPHDLEAVLGQPAWDFSPDADATVLRDAIREVFASGNSRTVEVRSTEPLAHWVIRIVPLGPGPLADRAMTIGTEVTEEKQLREQLYQAQKLESVGRLAGGIAHDLNNLLFPVLGYSELLAGQLSDDPFASEALGDIAGAAERARELTHKLLAFSRRQVLEMRVLDLKVVMQDFSKLLKRVLREDIDLELRLADDLHLVRADASQMEQIIINLVVNAQDAMPGGGDVAVIATNVAGTRGDWVSIQVADTGTGIEPEVLDRIFEPFFTTKERGKGTGLGLATVHGIVHQHGGRVEVDSRPGVGSTFTALLPAVAGPAAEATTVSPAAVFSLAGARPSVLVAEDEDVVRSVLCRMLREHGFEVVAAPNGEAALQLVQQDGPPDLLISDVVMPRLNGPDLWRMLCQQHGPLPVIFMSGYAETLVEDQLADNAVFLQKPFRAEALLERIAQVLVSSDVAGS